MKRVYLVWWVDYRDYESNETDAEIITSDLSPQALKKKLLAEANKVKELRDKEMTDWRAARAEKEKGRAVSVYERGQDELFYRSSLGKKYPYDRHEGMELELTEYIFNDNGDLEVKPD